jgi:hypothetical protein
VLSLHVPATAAWAIALSTAIIELEHTELYKNVKTLSKLKDTAAQAVVTSTSQGTIAEFRAALVRKGKGCI